MPIGKSSPKMAFRGRRPRSVPYVRYIQALALFLPLLRARALPLRHSRTHAQERRIRTACCSLWADGASLRRPSWRLLRAAGSVQCSCSAGIKRIARQCGCGRKARQWNTQPIEADSEDDAGRAPFGHWVQPAWSFFFVRAAHRLRRRGYSTKAPTWER